MKWVESACDAHWASFGVQGELAGDTQYQASYEVQPNSGMWDVTMAGNQMTDNSVQDPTPQLVEQPSVDTT